MAGAEDQPALVLEHEARGRRDVRHSVALAAARFAGRPLDASLARARHVQAPWAVADLTLHIGQTVLGLQNIKPRRVTCASYMANYAFRIVMAVDA